MALNIQLIRAVCQVDDTYHIHTNSIVNNINNKNNNMTIYKAQ